jgi:glycosyltransferase involved in cell wall biosynthesis
MLSRSPKIGNVKAVEQSVPPAELSILVLSHMYPRSHHPAGGIFVHEQVKALRALGLDIRVMSGEPLWINTAHPVQILRQLRAWFRRRDLSWEEHDGVPLLRFPYKVSRLFLPFQAHAFTYSLAAARCLSRMAGRWQFQLVHAHTAYLDGSAGAAIAKRQGLPLVITEHTGPFSTLTRTPYLRRKTQASINAADRLIAVSPTLLADIRDQIALSRPERALVLPNVVDTDAFKPAPRQVDGRITALWVGHFVPVKRVDRLLRALAAAVKTESRLNLRLVGDGELVSNMRGLARELGIANHVEFVGHVHREALALQYADCDFLVISSDTETFGVVAIEAMSCGRPVLTTSCGGPQAIVTDPSLGMVVERSEEGLHDGLLAIAARVPAFDPGPIRAAAIREYSSKSVAGRLKAIYLELLADTRS